MKPAVFLSPPRRSVATRADMHLCCTTEQFVEAPGAPRRASCVSHAESMKLCASESQTRSSNLEHGKMLRSSPQQWNGASSPMRSMTLSLDKSFNSSLSRPGELQEDDDDELIAGAFKPRRPASPHDYHLAIDYTASKMLRSVIDMVKQFQNCASAQYKLVESSELLTILVSLHEILQVILGVPCLDRYQEVLEDILLHASKAFAFLEKLVASNAVPRSSHNLHSTAMEMGDFACHFSNQTVRLCEDYETSEDDLRCSFSPGEERLSFGVTSYAVPLRNVSERLLKRKRVHIPVQDVDGRSQYNVELSYPRLWFRHKGDAMSAKVESNDRGFSQTLHAGREKVQKGSWADAQDTVIITYNDLMVANVAAISGSLLSHSKSSSHHSSSRSEAHSPKFGNAHSKYRTSIQIVGSSRIDADLQNLYIEGVKHKDLVYYKCYVNMSGHEEVLGIYRYQHHQFQNATLEGTLHIVGRGNQPGLRHVLVSIFASLGFTTAV